jgi:hypothetical protein
MTTSTTREPFDGNLDMIAAYIEGLEVAISRKLGEMGNLPAEEYTEYHELCDRYDVPSIFR